MLFFEIAHALLNYFEGGLGLGKEELDDTF